MIRIFSYGSDSWAEPLDYVEMSDSHFDSLTWTAIESHATIESLGDRVGGSVEPIINRGKRYQPYPVMRDGKAYFALIDTRGIGLHYISNLIYDEELTNDLKEGLV